MWCWDKTYKKILVIEIYIYSVILSQVGKNGWQMKTACHSAYERFNLVLHNSNNDV